MTKTIDPKGIIEDFDENLVEHLVSDLTVQRRKHSIRLIPQI